MKVAGLLDIHDPEIKCSKNINETFSSGGLNSDNLEEIAIINLYLRNGIPLIKYISPLHDLDNEYIGPNIIYTDGEWLWPGYCVFYLEKYPQIEIPKEFKEHIKTNLMKQHSISKLLLCVCSLY